MSSKVDDGIDRRRRGFFRELAAEAMSTAEKLRGIPQLRLDQIGSLPDQAIGAMTPVWNHTGKVRLKGTKLVQVGSDGIPTSTLLELGEVQMRLLALFDGRKSIRTIAVAWADVNGLSLDEAFMQVKRLFLPLAELVLLVPSGFPEP